MENCPPIPYALWSGLLDASRNPVGNNGQTFRKFAVRLAASCRSWSGTVAIAQPQPKFSLSPRVPKLMRMLRILARQQSIWEAVHGANLDWLETSLQASCFELDRRRCCHLDKWRQQCEVVHWVLVGLSLRERAQCSISLKTAFNAESLIGKIYRVQAIHPAVSVAELQRGLFIQTFFGRPDRTDRSKKRTPRSQCNAVCTFFESVSGQDRQLGRVA